MSTFMAEGAAPSTTNTTPAFGDDPRDRRRIITSNIAMFGAGAALCALVFLLVGDAVHGGTLAQRVAADAALLLILLAYISLSTRAAVRQLAEMIIAFMRAMVTDLKRSVVVLVRDTIQEEIKNLPHDHNRQDDLPDTVDLARNRVEGRVSWASVVGVHTTHTDTTSTAVTRQLQDTLAEIRAAAAAVTSLVEHVDDRIDSRLDDLGLLSINEQAMKARSSGSNSGVTKFPRART